MARRSASTASGSTSGSGSGSGTSYPALRRVGDLGVLREQVEQPRIGGSGLGQDGRDPVEPLELLAAAGVGQGLVGPHPGPLLPGEQRHHLELGAHVGHRRAPRDGGLHLADDARQHRDDPGLVTASGLRRTAAAVLRRSALASSSH
jgi:hypothetical protein